MLATLFSSILAITMRQDGATHIPFRMGEYGIIADATVNDRHVNALFDTGFGGDFVLSRDMDFGQSSGNMTLRDFVGESQAKMYPIKSLKVGDVTLDPTDKSIVAAWTNESSFTYGAHVDGIMGISVFKDSVFEIDMEHKQFVIYPPSHDISQTPVDGKKTFLVDMLPLGNHAAELPVVTSDGQSMTMALDTGNAFYATTHTDVLARLGLWKEGAKAKWVGKSGVASGPVDSFSAEMKNLTIFGVPVADSAWDVIDLPSSDSQSDGTVGYQFLRNFNITIDFSRRKVLLENWTGKLGGDLIASAGINALYDQRTQRMRVIRVVSDSPAEAVGVKLGDSILAVDGKTLGPMGLDSFRRLMEGPTDSEVKLQISRGGAFHTFDIKRQVLVNQLTKG